MKTATQTAPELMTKKQMAEYLQCSQRQVELLTAKGRLPKPVYLGESSPRWRRSDLHAWLESQSSAKEKKRVVGFGFPVTAADGEKQSDT